MAASIVNHALRPRVGVGVVIKSLRHPGCVVLGKRKGSAGSGMYALPGGHLEYGEEWAQCAERETEEETGLKIKNIKLGTVVNTVVKEVQYHYVTVFMEADIDEQSGKTEPENLEPHKCESWQWYDWKKFPVPDDELFYSLSDARKQGFSPDFTHS
ncbi:nucleotide triphosphate diphosphatase NUDT15-like [Amphiura filiformis]|uniref:nucleotide triphosphate diphosphatase NUDT15-like n=1 Tax=Amphiura filiformis TaxID=82378 RepID=UPI003B223947